MSSLVFSLFLLCGACLALSFGALVEVQDRSRSLYRLKGALSRASGALAFVAAAVATVTFWLQAQVFPLASVFLVLGAAVLVLFQFTDAPAPGDWQALVFNVGLPAVFFAQGLLFATTPGWDALHMALLCGTMMVASWHIGCLRTRASLMKAQT